MPSPLQLLFFPSTMPMSGASTSATLLLACVSLSEASFKSLQECGKSSSVTPSLPPVSLSVVEIRQILTYMLVENFSLLMLRWFLDVIRSPLHPRLRYPRCVQGCTRSTRQRPWNLPHHMVPCRYPLDVSRPNSHLSR